METNEVPNGSIVVGVDGSPASDRGLLWGLHQARLEHRPLAVVHALNPMSANMWMGEPGFNEALVLDAVRGAMRFQIDRAVDLAAEYDPSVEVHAVRLEQDPRDALLELSHHAAMIVMGSRGRGPMTSMLLGSVSLAVSQHATCPVVILRAEENHPIGTGEYQRGVVVGVDGTRRSTSALEFAYRTASLHSLPLQVVHAYWDEQRDGYPSMAPVLEVADLEDMTLLVAETIAGMAEKFPDVRASVHTERGLPHGILLQAAKNAAMLVVGTHPTHALYDVLTNEISRQVVGRAPCTVAVVPDAPSTEADPR